MIITDITPHDAALYHTLSVPDMAALYARCRAGEEDTPVRRSTAARLCIAWLRETGAMGAQYAESVLDTVAADFGPVDGPVEPLMYMSRVYAELTKGEVHQA